VKQEPAEASMRDGHGAVGIHAINGVEDVNGRKIPIAVLVGTTKWSRVRLHLERIAAAVNAARPGSYTEVEIPSR
jgi:hypothetical protein